MALETALAKVSMDVTSRRDPNNVYHLMTVSKLAELTPAIDWIKLFAETGVPGVTELNVTNPDFFKGLQAVLESTDLDTIKTYLRWQLINSIPSHALPKALDDEDFDFYGRKLRGQPEQEARWKRCVDATDGALGEAVGQVYVASQFPPRTRHIRCRWSTTSKPRWTRRSQAQAWMSAETKTKAEAKLHMVADKIGYPDHWRDYSTLKVVRGDAVGNALRAAEFENKRQLAKIGKPVDRGEWITTPATVNAFYNPLMNDINFPAGILQAPLYDPKATDAENYGHIGAIVGHELTHGFDDEGSQFDGNGNLDNWWTPDDKKKFDEMTDCEVKEYWQLHSCRRREGQRQADPGREHRRQRRPAPGLCRISGRREAERHRPRRQSRTASRRCSSSSLPSAQNWCGSDSARADSAAGADRPALAARIPRQRRGAEYAGVRQGLRLQSGPADDAGQRLSRLVSRRITTDREVFHQDRDLLRL